MSNIIKFVSNRPWLNKDSISKPAPAIKEIPEWFRKADRFAINPLTKDYWKGPDGGKIPTWKACPAIFDILGTGYVLKTPCDVEFYLKNNKMSVKIKEEKYKDFCSERQPMPQFVHPEGYYKEHFAWYPDWAIELPEGYSALYTTPFNRFDLPFFMSAGIVDNDKINLPGTMPFFIIKGFEGVVPAGTPYAQIIPFKREDWQSEVFIENPNSLYKKNQKNSDKYRVKDGGVYKNEVWSKRTYE
jgi:hypothetical protein